MAKKGVSESNESFHGIKPTQDTKKIMWLGEWRGFPTDSPYEFQGMKFFPRVVHPVSDRVYEAVSKLHNFVTVDTIKYLVVDYDFPDGTRILPSGDMI